MKVLRAEFLATATRRSQWPPGGPPELAFAGRSNVGKSSLLNALAGRRGLARVSATPGRTRALQFFEIEVEPAPAARPVRLRFCDLPGYGWAKVSRSEREQWAGMIEEYLRDRPELRAVVLLVDSRREPPESDREALAFLAAQGREVVVAATKVDKLARSRRRGAAQAAERALGLPPGSLIPFSAVDGTGAPSLWGRLLELAR